MKELIFILDKVNGAWQLDTEHGQEVGNFNTYQEVVQYCKNELPKEFKTEYYQVRDIENGGLAFFNGKELHTDSHWGMSDGFMIVQWLQDGKEEEPGEDDEDEGYDCNHCRDGGCIICSPQYFMS